MRALSIALAVLVAGCVPSPDSQRGQEEAAAQIEDQATPIPSTAAPAATPSASPAAAPSPTADAPAPRPELAEREPKAADPASLCWMDYCPCDTSDPDYGGSDPILCRRVRAGLPVSDELFSIGAGGRDARKQLREWKRDNGGF